MRLLALLVLLGGVAFATTTTTTTLVNTQSAGKLTVAQGATGSGNTGIVCISQSPGARVLQIDMVGSSTPSASFIIEHSTDGGTTWSTLGNACFTAMTAIALSTTTPGVSVPIMNPVGCYRVNITVFASGAFTATYQAQL